MGDNPVKEVQKVKSVWARHETFHPRYGWLKKGFDLARENPKIFTSETATVQLGVGKNMVKAIRYWCGAFKVLENDSPTDFGSLLLEDQGYDPYLENPASLWLLHWYLLKPPCEATAWYYVFNRFRGVEFSVEELTRGLQSYQRELSQSTAASSIDKDVTCILRMYVEPKWVTGLLEDSLDCPFKELGLIQSIGGESKRYTFRVGFKRNLPPEIIIVTCLEYASCNDNNARTIGISRLLYDEGSPGMVFKLSQEALCDAIEKVAREYNRINLSDTAGLIQLSFNADPEVLARDILEQYYSG
ncbi:MAG: hypothetical protein N5P05_001614 [Chroococcopsis gigantea SAG 12.99]|jgi:hypothetical protein|nr:hypothetical protein [Chroococcopsis gigantea SAG 12.99]